MVCKEMQFRGSEKLDDLDAFDDLLRPTSESTDSDIADLDHKRRLKNADLNYKNFLFCILPKEGRVESHKKRREKDDDFCEHDKDCCVEEDNDPQFELFLKKLKAHEKSYVLEDELNGLHIKYEGDSSSDEECDLEPRRKLRSAMKQKIRPSNQILSDENQFKHGSKSNSIEETRINPESRRKLRSDMKQKIRPSNQILSVENQCHDETKSSSTEETRINPEPRRKLRSAMKQKIGPFNQILSVENQCEHESKSNSTKEKRINPESSRKLRSAMKQKIGPSNQILTVETQYESKSNSTEETRINPEPRRKLRSAMKQKIGPSNQILSLENQCKHQSKSNSTEEIRSPTSRKSRNKTKSETVKNVKSSNNGLVPDPDYVAFFRSLKVVDDHCVFTHGDHTVVYWQNDREKNKPLKAEQDDECSSDVEILDSTSFYKEMNKDSILQSGGPRGQCEFREGVIAVLRNPYDKVEYDKLLADIELRKQEERHIELRHGRERSYSVNKCGKSYLDHHPDVRSKLLKLRDDKPKCLNLLRGFFFWLQNFLQNGSFKPWLDAECLAIYPESYGDHELKHGKSFCLYF